MEFGLLLLLILSHFVLNGSTFPTGHTYVAGSGTGRQEPNLPQTGNRHCQELYP